MHQTLEQHTTDPGDKPAPPRHVAIIMDGNGRWAKKHGLPRVEGHRKGMQAVRAALKGAADAGIHYLTLYAFSTENWNRPAEEVGDLMGLLRFYLDREVKNLHKEGIRLCMIGDRTTLAPDLLKRVEEAERLTANNTSFTLILAFSYGSRQEIVRAAKSLAKQAKSGEIDPDLMDEKTFSNTLYTKDFPDPDLIVRTSGEQRISNFLLWQAAYAEFVFMDVLWPDFTEELMHDAVSIYHSRDRRYGGR